MIRPVKLYMQEQSLSCEAATLHAGLAAFGCYQTEKELLSLMPFQPFPGNPNKGFVGKPNGKYMVDGYGIYSLALLPIARMFLPRSYQIRCSDFVQSYIDNVLDRNNCIVCWITLRPYESCAPIVWHLSPYESPVVSPYVHVVLLVARVVSLYCIMDPLFGFQWVSWEWLLNRMRLLCNMNIVLCTEKSATGYGCFKSGYGIPGECVKCGASSAKSSQKVWIVDGSCIDCYPSRSDSCSMSTAMSLEKM